MKAQLIMALLCAFATPLPAVDGADPEAVVLREAVVELQLLDASWFPGTMATVVIRLPEMIEESDIYQEDAAGLDIGAVELVSNDKGKGSTAVIRWMPREAGLLTFPSWSFETETTRYVSPARQIMVSSPQQTEQMGLTFTPSKTRVYAGEPLRVEVLWNSKLQANRQRALRCLPDFFSDEQIDLVIPRQEIDEKEQVGLPFGGRRIIARREGDGSAQNLGTITFPLYLRYLENGVKEITKTRLECAYLQQAAGNFAPYAAFFNNGLFEEVDAGLAYERLFTESSPVLIEVLGLPQEGRLETFSGLFSPCQIEASTGLAEITVGGVLEVDLLVRSQACHGMLELPDLSLQRSLRSWFKVDRELGRRWHPEGTLFRLRVRPLTTHIEAFPSLEIQVFDPELADYKILRTEAVPLKVLPDQGRDYFNAKRSSGNAGLLNDQVEGIRQNDQKNPMNDALNQICGWLADYYWLWLLLGPLLFITLLPRVREARRRALDPAYRKQMNAYRDFLKIPEGDPRKWAAMKRFLAAGFGDDGGAWTSGDAYRKLNELGVTKEDIEVVVGSQRGQDHEQFSESKTESSLPALKGVGQRIFKLLGKASMLCLLWFGTGNELRAAESHWNEAEAAFAQGLDASPGSPLAFASYSEAALKFEQVAETGNRPGSAWYNAGNAWFQAGELGRAIACFRQAEIYRPFDPTVKQSLTAARALTVDVVDGRGGSLWIWPRRWLAAILVPFSLGFWGLLLAFFRFRKSGTLITAILFLLPSLGLAGLLIWASLKDGSEGVLVATEVQARKGPSYRYQTAFLEALHDGLECRVIEGRDSWLEIELADGRKCWVPETQIRTVRNPW